MMRPARWTVDEVRPLQRTMLVAAGVCLVIAALCFATRLVRHAHGTYEASTETALAYGGAASAVATSLLMIATSVITFVVGKPPR